MELEEVKIKIDEQIENALSEALITVPTTGKGIEALQQRMEAGKVFMKQVESLEIKGDAKDEQGIKEYFAQVVRENFKKIFEG